MTTRFGILGTGDWAVRTHGRGLAAHPDVELVGMWGRDPGRTKAAADEVGVQPFDDLDALLESVDVVTVAVAPDVQADLAVRAAGAGRHLLLDKPLALDVAAAQRVVDATDAAGVASVVFFTARFRPDLEGFFEQLRAGQWTVATVTTLAPLFNADTPVAPPTWRNERGALWDVGPHALSTVMAGLGPVEAVAAISGDDDLVHLVVEHTAGGTSSLTISLTIPTAGRANSSTFYGAGGALTLPVGTVTSLEAFGNAVTQLLDAVASGRRDHPCDVRLGLDIVKVLAAAERSRRRDAQSISVN